MKKLLCICSASAILSLAACRGNHDYKTSTQDSSGSTTTSGTPTSGAQSQGARNSPGTVGDTSSLGRNNQNSNGETQDPTHH